jgi:hypothetical protein
MTTDTAKATYCHLKVATLNPYCLTVEQGISYFLPG